MRKSRRHWQGYWLLVWLYSPLASAQGGPPLITDDPDTPGNGHWEINAGGTTQANRTQQLGDLVHVDINYGLGDRIQLKYETGDSYAHTGDKRVNGPGDSITGVKYRFFQTGSEDAGYRVSVYPQVESRGPFGAKDPDLTTEHTYYDLPVEVKAAVGPLALDADLGRELAAAGGSGWFGGFAAGYNPVKEVELIAEARRQTSALFPLQGTLYEAGARLEASETFALMFAVGRLLADAPHGFYTVGYLGLRLSF